LGVDALHHPQVAVAFIDAAREILQATTLLSGQSPLLRERLRNLQHFAAAKRLLQSHESIRMSEQFAGMLPRVVRVLRAKDNLHVRVLFPQMRDCFDSIPTRWRPCIHEYHRVRVLLLQCESD
jgi:hypothetical protein